MTPNRVISSSDSSSVSVRPSRSKSRSRRCLRVGSARALKTRSSSVTLRSYVTEWSHVKLGLESALEREQLLLAVEPARIADEGAAGAHDSVAREHDRDRVAVHHDADRSGCLRPVRLGGEGSVRRQLSVGDARKALQ